MRIVIIQDYLRNGGTERQTLFLATFFQRIGWDVSLLVFRPGGRLSEDAVARGLAVKVLQGRNTGVSFYAPGLRKAIVALRPDIALCMGRSANCYAGLLQRWFRDVVVVGTVRTGKQLMPFQKWAFRHLGAVLVNSSWWKRRLLKQGYPADHIHVVRNAILLNVDPQTQMASRKRLRRREELDDDVCVFLNVATFRPGKRHVDLLRSFARLTDCAPNSRWRLWLVGEGQHLSRCRKLAASLGISEKVHFWGYQHDPLPFYAASDAAVSASLEDALPNFLIEAQAAGIPTIAYDYRGVRECCRDGETGIVIPAGDAAAFVRALEDLLQDIPLRQRMGRAAPAFAQQRFSAEPQAERIRRFLTRLKNGNDRRI